MDLYKVYKHTAPNGKVYIGITKVKYINDRWQKGKGYWSNIYFTNAINKYGWDNIQHKILFVDLSKEEAEKKEKELIKQYKSNQREFGFNIEDGGSLNKNVSQETKEKLRQNALGKKASEETKQKMSASHKGEKNYWYGKHLSTDMKQKISLKKKKKINQYDLNGNFIQKYNSMKEAAEKFGVTRQNIYASCSKKRKSACGYVWRYANE